MNIVYASIYLRNASPSICYKVFTDKSNLKTHVDSVHERKKPFLCTICDTGFGSNQGLKKHIFRKHREIETTNQWFQYVFKHFFPNKGCITSVHKEKNIKKWKRKWKSWYLMCFNVCFIKFRSKHSTVLLLCLLWNLMKQALYDNPKSQSY